MDKRADKLISIWWFFVIGVIAGGIVIGTLIYYSGETSVKKIEAEILNQRIFDCLSHGNNLDERILNKDFNAVEECNLNAEVFGKASFFFLKISAFNSTDSIVEKNYGDSSFEKDCQIVDKISTKKFPRCFSRTKTFLINGQKVQLKVLSASNQEGMFISNA